MLCILLIEDNPGDAHLIRELLSDVETEKYNITHVERINDAINIVKSHQQIDVILSDITLPDSSGVDTLQQLTLAAPHLPILFMTGTNDEALAVSALKRGAQDYLIKGHATGNELAKSIQYSIERKKTQIEFQEIKSRETQNIERIKSLAKERNHLIELNRSKDEFVSIASHQLRTPATAVKQYVGMITEGIIGTVDEAAMELLKSAYESNERQLTVIDELLKTAQLDSPRMTLDYEETDIEKLLKDVIANQLSILNHRNQTVQLRVDEQYIIQIDSSEVRLVFENLLENASKYSDSDTAITIHATTEDDELLVHFTDQGVGIKNDNINKIFQKFTRVDNELSDTVSGTGLGLYWVQRIVELHGGSISVISEISKGSTFTVKLPYEHS